MKTTPVTVLVVRMPTILAAAAEISLSPSVPPVGASVARSEGVAVAGPAVPADGSSRSGITGASVSASGGGGASVAGASVSASGGGGASVAGASVSASGGGGASVDGVSSVPGALGALEPREMPERTTYC